MVPRVALAEWGILNHFRVKVREFMHYVYILKSQKDNSRYRGSSANLKKRFYQHNAGEVISTASKRPYELMWYAAFKDKNQALFFEKYLKSSSGYAFTKKHLL